MRLRIATTVQQKPLTMFYTYILRSIEHPEQRYIGHTADLRERLKKHNKGDVPHTAKFRPWKVETYITKFSRGCCQTSRKVSNSLFYCVSRKRMVYSTPQGE